MKARMENGRTEDIKAVWFENGKVRMIDQRELPLKLVIVDFEDYRDVAMAIKNMTTRGAPCIGASAAYAMCLAGLKKEDLDEAARYIKAARPTAYDLFYATDWMYDRLKAGDDPVKAADAYSDLTVDKCRKIGESTVDVGTALAPMRNAHDAGKKFFVYASETRPRLQGMQLTAWELNQEGIDHAIIPDGSAAYYMSQGVDMIIVGADRIAANGDFANKIGTFDKAIVAKHFGIPFYVAAPVSTFDFSTKTGKDIVIEQRSEEEMTMVKDIRIAPVGSKALNPAFDVTPAEFVTGFITEKGIFKPTEISEMKE